MINKEDLRIVFMGTPDFAVESLRILVENEYNVVGVITMPDKPSGRGHKIQYSAVKKYALKKNLPLLQPEKLKDESFLESLKNWNADIQIVVAFRMLPEIVWDMPPKGTFNLHASLLPQYRGAAPINWAIINGDKETGATTFFLTHEIDTGKIIKQTKIAISDADNAGIVHDKLMISGAQLVQETINLVLNDQIETVSQESMITADTELKSAPKIFKETCKIDWQQSAQHIFNRIRGLSPYPTAWAELQLPDQEIVSVKIYSSSISQIEQQQTAGTVETDNKTYLRVYCIDGAIDILEIQLPNKKAMKIEELLRGFKFPENSFFS